MTYIKENPITKVVDYKYSEFMEHFFFGSTTLQKAGFQYDCCIPAGFIMDWESVPIIKGTSKIAGAIHDYFSRRDSVPVVTKKMAADIYLEFMKFRKTPKIRMYTKYWTVRIWGGYFHTKDISWKPPKNLLHNQNDEG
jgi:hypothetical protein